MAEVKSEMGTTMQGGAAAAASGTQAASAPERGTPPSAQPKSGSDTTQGSTTTSPPTEAGKAPQSPPAPPPWKQVRVGSVAKTRKAGHQPRGNDGTACAISSLSARREAGKDQRKALRCVLRDAGERISGLPGCFNGNGESANGHGAYKPCWNSCFRSSRQTKICC